MVEKAKSKTEKRARREEKIFIFHSPMRKRDLSEFRRFVKTAARLLKYGRVLVDIGALAEKSVYELPRTFSPWHEYTSMNPNLCKFFPHPKIARHIPKEHVRKNRELLVAKARILKELGLGTSFSSYEPNFLPESFFRELPHLRGPRVDHPRRSSQEAFSPLLRPTIPDPAQSDYSRII